MATAVEPSGYQGAAETLPIWKRQPREPANAFAAFIVYREQDPPRSLARAAKAVGHGLTHLKRWSAKWNWVERADEYTGHLDSLMVQATEEDIVRRRREENETLYQVGKDMQTSAHARITGLEDAKGKLVVAPLDPNQMDFDDVARWLSESTKAIRLAMGLPTDLVAGKVQISLTSVEVILGGFFEVAEKHTTPEAHEAIVRECYALLREQLGE